MEIREGSISFAKKSVGYTVRVTRIHHPRRSVPDTKRVVAVSGSASGRMANLRNASSVVRFNTHVCHATWSLVLQISSRKRDFDQDVDTSGRRTGEFPKQRAKSASGFQRSSPSLPIIVPVDPSATCRHDSSPEHHASSSLSRRAGRSHGAVRGCHAKLASQMI